MGSYSVIREDPVTHNDDNDNNNDGNETSPAAQPVPLQSQALPKSN